MARIKTMTVDFYRAIDTKGRTLKQMFTELVNLAAEKREVELVDSPVWLHRLEENSGIFEGDFIRKRKEDGTMLVHDTGGIKGLNDDESLGESTAFIFDSLQNVLLIQRNRVGVTVSKFFRFIEEYFFISHPIDFAPLFTADALHKLRTMKVIRRFELKIQRPNDTSSLKDKLGGVSSAIDCLASFDSAVIEVNLGMGKKKGSMSRRDILTTANNLVLLARDQPGAVNRLRISAKEDDMTEQNVLDLLNERLHVKVQFESSNQPDKHYAARRSELAEVWKNKRKTVAEIVSES